MSQDQVLTIQDLHFAYEPAKPILQIEEFAVGRGESIFIHAPSGSGKSTLLNCLAGTLRPQKGTIQVMDQNITALSPTKMDRFRGEHMGYIFQSLNLIEFLSVAENLKMPLWLNAARKKNWMDQGQSLEDWGKRLGIGHLLQQKANQISKGEQQRVACLRAMIGSPDLILADEPTAALDKQNATRLIRFLLDLANENKTTLIVVSHELEFEKLFTRSVALDRINRPPPSRGD